jgi:ABC-type multidrug transport system fused ATPase/permease subunit
MGAIPWASVFRWALYVVGMAPWWVALETAVTLAISLLTMYTFVVLGTVISALRPGETCTGANCPSSDLTLPFVPLPHDGGTAAIVFAVLTLVLIVSGYANRLLGAWITNMMVGRMREEIHDKLLTLGSTFQQKFDTGRSMLLMTAYVSIAQMMLKEVITAPIIKGVSIAGALFFLAALLSSLQEQNNLVHTILLVGLVALPVIGWFLAARLRAAFARALDSQVHLTDEFMNSIHRTDEVQLMGAGPQRSKAFAARVHNLVRDQFAAEAGRELANAFQSAMPTLLQVVLLVYGIFVALQSGSVAAAGAIVALYQLVPQAISPIQELLQIAAAFTASWPQVEAVIEVFEAEPEGGKRDGTLELGPNDRSVTFRDVAFAYASDHPKIIDGVSHVFPAGQVTAIVARFGTGKSTVLNLIARLRRPIGGSILIGDKGIGQLKRDSLRANVVKVSQFPLLISDTVRENFRLAKADATDEEIEAISRRTGLWDVLVKETPPGEDPLSYMVSRQEGVGLSGGQRRILAVTRALLLEPTVLLLDEPTTGIDPIGRHDIYETLAKACAGLTVVVVDQDTNFITHFAQQICCLENGKFVDVGSPAELMQRQSLFKRLSEASSQ